MEKHIEKTVPAVVASMQSDTLKAIAADYESAVLGTIGSDEDQRRFWRAFQTGDVARAVEQGDLGEARRSATVLLLRAARGTLSDVDGDNDNDARQITYLI